MTDSIDKIDRAILAILQNDATLSVDAISERVSLSRNACWRRIKQMEEAGILKARVALVDATKIGLGLPVFVLMRAADHSPDWLAKFDRAVRILPEIIGAHRMSGDLDYVLRVQVADVADYDRFYKRLIELVPVRDISASFVMENIKDTTALPV
ncbi:Lrp/AsnC family transcriptional regulator [uncultured Litoreibacter sp.]|uniref:Lrp/AsnC family transcriptional regulator n=1 Tax=uncultured Litoreibacter sp. TaxID=1392394 RepID=UPI00262227B6|nr:Lrp/AsnC family transcriptional regulator [uncultured Litoreibacter sp.]